MTGTDKTMFLMGERQTTFERRWFVPKAIVAGMSRIRNKIPEQEKMAIFLMFNFLLDFPDVSWSVIYAAFGKRGSG